LRRLVTSAMSWWKEAHHGSILCGPTTSALLAQPALAYLDPATDLPLHSVTVIRDGLLVLDAFLGFPQFWNNNAKLCIIALIEGPLLWKLSAI